MKLTAADGYPYYFELAKGKPLSFLFSSTLTYDKFQSLDEERAIYRYAPGKWSIKQVIGHITDHERIKMARAFQLSRRIPLELWGYDQELLIKNSRFDELPTDLLLKDYLNVRKASQSFVESLSESQLQLEGNARKHAVTLEGFLRSIIGHEQHHLHIIDTRY